MGRRIAGRQGASIRSRVPARLGMDDAAIQSVASTFRQTTGKENLMLYWAAVFFVIALVAAIFGFGGIAVGAAEIAKVLFFIFLVVFVVSLIWGLLRR
jgi:uncharacterized membrane protein YtjA (UPF0391 family)